MIYTLFHSLRSILSLFKPHRMLARRIVRQFHRPWKPGVYCRVVDLGRPLGKVFQFRPQFGKTVDGHSICKSGMEKELLGQVSLN